MFLKGNKMIGAILGIGKLVLGGVMKHFEHKRNMQQARQASELRWAEKMADATQTSWKDEFITIVIMLPIIGAMFGYPELGERAFIMMQQAPEWFTIAFMTVVGGSFGVSLFGKYKKIKNGDKETLERVVRIENAGPKVEDE